MAARLKKLTRVAWDVRLKAVLAVRFMAGLLGGWGCRWSEL
jgi:hypothetical protein